MNKHIFPILLTLLLTTGCSQEQSDVVSVEKSRISVQPLLIEPHSVVGHIESLGVLESAEAITVNVEFSAPVKKVFVHEGQRIKKGQPMLSFDTGKLALQREQVHQDMTQEITQLGSDGANLERLKILAEKQSVSRQRLDDATFSYQGAQARVSQLQAKLKLIDKDIANSQVKSPIDAVVGERFVEAGIITSPMQPLFSLEADNSMKFVCYVSESLLPYLEEGSPARVVTVNGVFESAIYSISAKSDPHTGNFEVKILLENELGQLRPGMTGDVKLTTLASEKQIVIPEKALGAYNGQHVVYRIEEGKAIRQRVKVQLGFDDKLFVSKGLEYGQSIATEHVDLLTDGTEVE